MNREKLLAAKEWLSEEKNRDAIRLCWEQLKYFLKHAGIRSMQGNLTFGLEDPYTVGKLLGFLSIFYPVYGESFRITPVFDRKVLEGKVYLKGHIRLIHVLLVGIRLFMNRELRKLILQDRKGKHEREE